MHDLTKRSFHSFKLPTGEVLKPVTWSIRHKESGQSNHQCVPLLPVTVNDAIADLVSAREKSSFILTDPICSRRLIGEHLAYSWSREEP